MAGFVLLWVKIIHVANVIDDWKKLETSFKIGLWLFVFGTKKSKISIPMNHSYITIGSNSKKNTTLQISLNHCLASAGIISIWEVSFSAALSPNYSIKLIVDWDREKLGFRADDICINSSLSLAVISICWISLCLLITHYVYLREFSYACLFAL